jgi:hypothetical protein
MTSNTYSNTVITFTLAGADFITNTKGCGILKSHY